MLPGSRIGEIAAIACRSGDDWFAGILDGGGSHDYKLNLCFLGSGEYEMIFVSDCLASQPVAVENIGVNQKTARKEWTGTVGFRVAEGTTDRQGNLKIQLAGGGGFVAWIRKHTP